MGLMILFVTLHLSDYLVRHNRRYSHRRSKKFNLRRSFGLRTAECNPSAIYLTHQLSLLVSAEVNVEPVIH
jgi:hypothetical protein